MNIQKLIKQVIPLTTKKQIVLAALYRIVELIVICL
jgi:hypothetical protein